MNKNYKPFENYKPFVSSVTIDVAERDPRLLFLTERVGDFDFINKYGMPEKVEVVRPPGGLEYELRYKKRKLEIKLNEVMLNIAKEFVIYVDNQEHSK